MLAKAIPILIDRFVRLAGTSWGKRILERSGPKILTTLLLVFLGRSDNWRKKRMAQIAIIASNIGIRAFTSSHTPEAVKWGIVNIVKGFASVRKRRKWRKKYGVAPTFFTMDPTDRCNLNCYGCYAGAESGKTGNDLSFTLMDRAILEMGANFGVRFVVLSGGEPFRRWKDVATLAYLHRDVSFLVYTNGTLITEEVVTRLAELGNIFPAISVEGFERETDARRGKGHFQRIMRVMDALNQAGIVFGFSATATSENAGVVSSDKFVDYYIGKGCKFGWYFIYIPIGRNPDMDLMVSPEQRRNLAEQIYKWRDEQKPILVADFWNDGPLVGGCIAAGRRYFHLKASGDIGPCVFCTLSAGNIKEINSANCEVGPLTDVILFSRLFKDYRWVQGNIHCLAAPCPIIDQPDLLAVVGRESAGAKRLPNTPEWFDDIESPTRQEFFERARAWQTHCKQGNHLKGAVISRVGSKWQ